MESTKGQKATLGQKATAAATYVWTGSQIKAAAAIGVTQQAISKWCHEDNQFIELLAKAREQYDAEMPHVLSGVMNEAIEQVRATLRDARAKEAATIYGILFDKRQVISNKPTSISSSSADLQKQLEEANQLIMTAYRQRQRPAVVDGKTGTND